MTHKCNGKWKAVELGEIIDIFDSIRVPLNSRQRAERQGKYPYYGASGIIDSVDDYLFDGEYVLVAEDGENLNSRKLPVAFMARGQFWVNNHAHIIKGKKGVAGIWTVMWPSSRFSETLLFRLFLFPHSASRPGYPMGSARLVGPT